MTLKLNISNKGKSWKLEVEPEVLEGKSIGDKFDGKVIKPELEGYELEITGGSDKSGFPMAKNVEGIGYSKKLLTKGWGMHSKPKGESKKKQRLPKGLRLRKTVRGKTISEKTIQVNIIILKEGSKKLTEIFPDQNKAPEPKEEPKKEVPTPTEEPAKTESQKEEKVAEEIAEEVKEEIKEDIPTSPETKTDEKKEEAAEKVAEEVKEEVEEVAEKIAEDEEKKE